MRLFRLSVVACALVAAGCTTVLPTNDTYAFRPGAGTVEEVHKAQPRWIAGSQLSLRMDDGTSQAITQDSNAFRAGERVQITPQGSITKLPPIAMASVTAPSAPAPLAAGGATVQSVAPASEISAAAGASAPSSADTQTLSLHMDDGTTQVLAVGGASFQPGERVGVTSDGRVLKP
jgi:outer membrane lipoprotein SlyB